LVDLQWMGDMWSETDSRASLICDKTYWPGLWPVIPSLTGVNVKDRATFHLYLQTPDQNGTPLNVSLQNPLRSSD
jgi:hypothetical protein